MLTTYTTYYFNLQVSVRNAPAETKYTWTQVANVFVQQMTLNYNAKFLSQPTVAS